MVKKMDCTAILSACLLFYGILKDCLTRTLYLEFKVSKLVQDSVSN